MPAASYALLPNLKKGLFFAIGEGSRKLSPVFYTAAPTGRFVNTVTRGSVGAPITSAPRSDFMAQSLVLSLDVCPGLGISPLRTNIWLSFSQADLCPRSAQELFFSFFLKSLRLLFRIFVLIASGTEIFWRESLKLQLFYGNIAFPLSLVEGWILCNFCD